jgi:hypothetical protein
MAKLSAKGRKRVKAGNFAIPSRRAYPIQDLAHARNALARVRQFGSAEDKRQVYAAVRRKYPSLAERSSVIRTRRKGGTVASRKQIAAAKRNLRKARAARRKKTTARRRRK